jgi:ATP-binding cassette subfamily F protein uup
MRARFLEKLMTLLKFSDVSLAFGAMPLLDKVSWCASSAAMALASPA